MQIDSSLGIPSSLEPEEDSFREADRLGRLEVLYREQRPALVRMLYKKVHNIDIAQEIAQEAYAAVYEHEKRGQRITLLRHYLFRTARNLAFDLLRRRAIRTRDAHFVAHPTITDAPSAEQMCIQQQESLYLQEAVRHLPPKCRQAFQLVELEGQPIAVVAEQMGVLPNSVSQLCNRAYAHLARALKELDDNRLKGARA